MTIRRVLVAVDDSPAALRAAEVALDLATGWDARVHLVSVTTDHALGVLIDTAAPDGEAADRIEEGARALLRHLADGARSRGVDVDTAQLAGEAFREILDEATRWEADLIVMGRSDRRGPSSPYVGSATAHVLEFAACPVLVVPHVVERATVPDPTAESAG